MLVNVGLESWIVQDGNYGEFEAGSEHRFALEFHPNAIEPTLDTSRGTELRIVTGAMYDVLGEVVYVSNSCWVVDFGVPAFQESPPPSWASPGRMFSGSTYIGIDPFFYFERLKDEPGMPELFRRWRVRQIVLETTPWRETATASGGKLIERASVTPTFVEVPRTDCWNDDQGRAHYILRCELQGAS